MQSPREIQRGIISPFADASMIDPHVGSIISRQIEVENQRNSSIGTPNSTRNNWYNHKKPISPKKQDPVDKFSFDDHHI